MFTLPGTEALARAGVYPAGRSAMGSSRKVREQYRGSDPVWWGLTVLLSLASLWLPSLFNLGADETTELIVVQSALLFTGGLVAFACPRRPWRWPLASFVTFALRDLVLKLSAPGSTSAGDAAAFMLANFPADFLNAMPVLVGAYVSALISRAGLD